MVCAWKVSIYVTSFSVLYTEVTVSIWSQKRYIDEPRSVQNIAIAIYVYERSTCRYVRFNALNVTRISRPRLSPPLLTYFIFKKVSNFELQISILLNFNKLGNIIQSANSIQNSFGPLFDVEMKQIIGSVFLIMNQIIIIIIYSQIS